MSVPHGSTKIICAPPKVAVHPWITVGSCPRLTRSVRTDLEIRSSKETRKLFWLLNRGASIAACGVIPNKNTLLTIWINDWGRRADLTSPFGGYKQSGHARDKCMDSLRSYTQLKSAWIQLGSDG